MGMLCRGGMGRSVVMTEGQQIEEQCPGRWALRFLSPMAACPQGAVRQAQPSPGPGMGGWAGHQSLTEGISGLHPAIL